MVWKKIMQICDEDDYKQHPQEVPWGETITSWILIILVIISIGIYLEG